MKKSAEERVNELSKELWGVIKKWQDNYPTEVDFGNDYGSSKDVCFRFEYPSYGGISKKTSSKLSSEAIDIIQDLVNHTDLFVFKSLADLRQELMHLLIKI